MSVRVEPFQVSDLLDLDVQERHAHLVPVVIRHLGLLGLNRLCGPRSYTVWDQYGRPVACCGVLDDGGGWAFLGSGCGRHMLAITRAARAVLDAFPGSVYADIDPDHDEAGRWARILGYQAETPTRWVRN